jgi:hypothetical protein
MLVTASALLWLAGALNLLDVILYGRELYQSAFFLALALGVANSCAGYYVRARRKTGALLAGIAVAISVAFVLRSDPPLLVTAVIVLVFGGGFAFLLTIGAWHELR